MNAFRTIAGFFAAPNGKPVSLVMATVAGLTLIGQPLVAAPAAYWDLEEGTGTTIADKITSTLSDPFGTGVSWSTTTPGPGSSHSLSFNNEGGVGLNLDSAAVGISGSAAKTIVAWIKTSTTDSAFDPILGYSPTVGATAGADLRLLVNNTGKLRLEANVGNFAISGATVNDDNWWMVGLVIPDSVTTAGVSFYTRRVDSVDVGTLAAPASVGGSATLNTATGSEMFIGQDGNAGRVFLGLIDNVQIYNSALTKGELDSIYDVMLVPEPSGLALLGLGGLLAFSLRRRQA